MPKHPEYCVMDLHVPTYFHDRIAKAVARSDPVSIKLDLTGTPEHRLYVTIGQKKKIQEAVARGRRDMTLRLSAKQAKHNVQSEGGFLAGLLKTAVRFLPSILAGIAAGTAEYHKEGNGMFLGKRDHTYQITHSGEGLLIKPVEHRKIQGFYVKHGEHEFRGKGVLHSLFGQIPLLNILF
jgi:hypothetical protein